MLGSPYCHSLSVGLAIGCRFNRFKLNGDVLLGRGCYMPLHHQGRFKKVQSAHIGVTVPHCHTPLSGMFVSYCFMLCVMQSTTNQHHAGPNDGSQSRCLWVKEREEYEAFKEITEPRKCKQCKEEAKPTAEVWFFHV